MRHGNLKHDKCKYISLHNHDEFSILDGASPTKRLVSTAAKLGMPALAISNHGVLGGALRHYLVSQEVGIKPIFGMEGYVNNHRHKDIPGLIKATTNEKSLEKLKEFRKEEFGVSPHFLILAKNKKGFGNLIKIANDAQLNGFYRRPRTDIEFLAQHAEGLIFSTACLGGHFARLLEKGKTKTAVKDFNTLRDAIGKEDLYVEIIPLEMELSVEHNKRLISFAQLVEAPILITGDAHFAKKKDAIVQRVLMLMRQRKTLKDAEEGNAWTYDNTDIYLKTYEEMKQTWDQHYSWAPDWVFEQGTANTIKIADQIEEFCPATASIPKYKGKKSANAEMISNCVRELKKRKFGSAYASRLKHEISVIKDQGFADYFLIYRDVVRWAKQQGIRVGPGRGSAGGCLVAYLLDITEIDPIKHGLLFERFLDPGRPDPPDIDVDFEPERRAEVKQYIFDHFGNAATIGTYSRLQVKAVLKDVGRVYGCSPQYLNALTASLPFKAEEASWKELLKQSEPLRDFVKDYPEAFYVAARLKGQIAHKSKHAAGVVITLDPIEEVLPIHKDGDTRVVAWPDSDNYRELSRMGFLKWDVLGVAHLSIISKTIEFVKQTRGEEIDISNIALDDAEALKIACNGFTDGIFQFGTPTAKRLLRSIGVDTFNDLVAITAIGRPGPINAGYPLIYSRRKKGLESYLLHPLTEDVLDPTYGLIIYQEQIMKLGAILGGFSKKEVNYFRKVIGKKRDPAELKPYKDRFVGGCVEKGWTQEDADQLWKDIKGFAQYGFNKSHATAYALIAYQELYLKAHYPKEFMAALLTCAPNKKQHGEKIERQHIREAFRMGLEVHSPDVNQSTADYAFTPELRMGLSFILNIGNSAQEIAAHAPYDDFDDFFEKVNKRKVNKRVVESLIDSGALDCLSEKKTILSKRRDLYDIYQELREDKEPSDRKPNQLREAIVREATTVGSPISSLRLIRKFRPRTRARQLKRIIKQDTGFLIGVVSKIKTHTTKFKDQMAFILIEDETGSLDITLWPSQWEPIKDKVEIGDLVSCRFKREPAYNKKYGDFSYFAIGELATTEEIFKFYRKKVAGNV